MKVLYVFLKLDKKNTMLKDMINDILIKPIELCRHRLQKIRGGKEGIFLYLGAKGFYRRSRGAEVDYPSLESRQLRSFPRQSQLSD